MLYFVTGNEGKVREATEYFGKDVQQVDYDYPEVQSDDLGVIAARGAHDAYERVGEPVIVDDTGLFIDALSGFPGPYTSYALRTLGVERVSELARAEPNPRARFRCAIAYCDGNPVELDDIRTPGEEATIKLFEGEVEGRIVEPRGENGFGFDSIFEYDGRTLAQMTVEETNKISHRGQAFERLVEWFDERQETT